MVLISAHRTHHTQSRNNVHAYPVITVFRTAYHPPPNNNPHSELSYEIMYSNNEQYCILYLKQWYNYVYLFTRYLLPENTSKLYSSLHTKQNTRLDFLLQIRFNLLQ